MEIFDGNQPIINQELYGRMKEYFSKDREEVKKMDSKSLLEHIKANPLVQKLQSMSPEELAHVKEQNRKLMENNLNTSTINHSSQQQQQQQNVKSRDISNFQLNILQQTKTQNDDDDDNLKEIENLQNQINELNNEKIEIIKTKEEALNVKLSELELSNEENNILKLELSKIKEWASKREIEHENELLKLKDELSILNKDYEEFKNNHHLQISNFEIQLRKLQATKDDLELTIEGLQDVELLNDTLQNQITEKEKEIESLIKNYENKSLINNEELEVLKRENETLSKEKAELLEETQKALEEKKEIIAKMKHSKHQFDKLKQQSSERAKEITRLKEIEEKYEELIETKDDENIISNLNSQILDKDLCITGLESKLETLVNTNKELEEEINKNKIAYEEINNRYKGEKEELQEEYELIKGKLEEIKEVLSQRDTEIFELETQVDELNVLVERGKENINEKDDEISGLKELMGKREGEISQWKEKYEEIEKAMLWQKESFSENSEKIEELKNIIEDLKDGIKSKDAIIKEKEDAMEKWIESNEDIINQLKSEIEIKNTLIEQKENELKSEIDIKNTSIEQKEMEIENMKNVIKERDEELQRCQMVYIEKENGFKLAIEDVNVQLKDKIMEYEELVREKEEETLGWQETIEHLKGKVKIEKEQALEIRALKDKNENYEIIIKEKDDLMKELDKKLSDTIEHEIVLKNEITEKSDILSKRQEEISMLKNNLNNFSKNQKNFFHTIQEKDMEIQNMIHIKIEYEKLKENYNVKISQIEKLEKEKFDLNEELSVKIQKIEEHEKEIKEIKERNVEERRRADEAEMHVRNSKMMGEEAQKMAEKTGYMETSLAERDAKIQIYQDEIKNLKNQNAAIMEKGEEMATLETKLTNIEQELKLYKNSAKIADELKQKLVRLETALAITDPLHNQDGLDIIEKVSLLTKRLSEIEKKEMALKIEKEILDDYEKERNKRIEMEKMLSEKVENEVAMSQNRALGISNKKDEDKKDDIEAAVLSGGDSSGFQPMSGLLRGLSTSKYFGSCIKGADFTDRGFIILMRQPVIRVCLLTYFLLLHVIAFLL